MRAGKLQAQPIDRTLTVLIPAIKVIIVVIRAILPPHFHETITVKIDDNV